MSKRRKKISSILDWWHGGDTSAQFTLADEIFSVQRYNGYNGYIFRLRHVTTNVEQDFGLDSTGWFDHQAVVNFWSAADISNNLIVCTIWYGQKGLVNGIQTTEANMPYYGGLAYNGKPCLFFNRRDSALDHFFNIAINTDSRDLGVHAICRGIVCFFPGTASTDVLFTSGGNPSTFTLSDNTVFRGSSTRLDANVGAQSAEHLNIVNSGYRSHTSASHLSYRYDHLTQTFTVFASTRINTTALLGKRSNATNKQCGEFQELVIYKPSVVSLSSEASFISHRRAAFGVLTKQFMWIGDIDSLTYGYASTNPINNPQRNSWPWSFARLMGETHSCFNFGISGTTLATVLTQGNWVTRTTMLGDTTLIPCYVLWGGTNDIGTDQSLATCQSRMEAVVSAIRTAEPNCRIVFLTTISRTIFVSTPAREVVRLDFNQWIRDTYFTDVSAKNYLCDVAADPLLGAQNAYLNTTYFDVDGDHLNTNGLSLVASKVYDVGITVV